MPQTFLRPSVDRRPSTDLRMKKTGLPLTKYHLEIYLGTDLSQTEGYLLVFYRQKIIHRFYAVRSLPQTEDHLQFCVDGRPFPVFSRQRRLLQLVGRQKTICRSSVGNIPYTDLSQREHNPRVFRRPKTMYSSPVVRKPFTSLPWTEGHLQVLPQQKTISRYVRYRKPSTGLPQTEDYLQAFSR